MKRSRTANETAKIDSPLEKRVASNISRALSEDISGQSTATTAESEAPSDIFSVSCHISSSYISKQEFTTALTNRQFLLFHGSGFLASASSECFRTRTTILDIWLPRLDRYAIIECTSTTRSSRTACRVASGRPCRGLERADSTQA